VALCGDHHQGAPDVRTGHRPSVAVPIWVVLIWAVLIEVVLIWGGQIVVALTGEVPTEANPSDHPAIHLVQIAAVLIWAVPIALAPSVVDLNGLDLSVVALILESRDGHRPACLAASPVRPQPVEIRGAPNYLPARVARSCETGAAALPSPVRRIRGDPCPAVADLSPYSRRRIVPAACRCRTFDRGPRPSNPAVRTWPHRIRPRTRGVLAEPIHLHADLRPLAARPVGAASLRGVQRSRQSLPIPGR